MTEKEALEIYREVADRYLSQGDHTKEERNNISNAYIVLHNLVYREPLEFLSPDFLDKLP